MTTAQTVPDDSFAGVGRRVGAYAIDSATVAVLSVLGSILLGGGVASEQPLLLALGLLLVLLAVGYGLWVLIGIGRTGRSPGKRALGLAVLDAETREPIGVLRAFVRQLVVGVLGPVNLVQLFLIPQHARRQGWHDLAARSVVVELDPAARPLAPSVPAASVPPAPPAPGPVIHTQQRPLPSSGMVAPPPVVVPPPPPPAAAPTLPPVGERAASAAPEATVARPNLAPAPGPQPSWELAAITGATTSLHQLVLAGRDPDVALVAGSVGWRITDPELTVSKTHALFGVTDGEPWVEDWHSTNGVLLRRGGEENELAPHERVPLQRGDELLLGDFALRVRAT